MGALRPVLKLSVKNNVPMRPISLSRLAILRVTSNRDCPLPLRSRHALLQADITSKIPSGFGMVLLRGAADVDHLPLTNVVRVGADLDYLAEGDVLRITPEGQIRTVYRRAARSVSLLVTERCNSFCVMCSQPPRDVNDDYLVDDYLEAIPLFDRGTHEVGITGGEPTLLGNRLFVLLRALKAYLPETAVHVLSNGRTSSDLSFAQRFAEIQHPDLMLGIPLYSDTPAIHDFVVQADGAYDETLRGILNLKRCGVRVEIRVVIHRHTYRRLPDLARFIVRNLQFVDHVALMGLELMGFARSNLDELWIDPADYQAQLRDATLRLAQAGIRTSIYNHQLCLLDRELHAFSVKSISDWKNEFMPECAGCRLIDRCAGFFSSATLRRSRHIRAILG
jgi:His-Xaa-Ser system radical SAM maturase HxsC